MIKVSIIVPIYNVEHYLVQCVESLINQTLKDIEIILIDDGSTDGSFRICKKFEKLDSRIKACSKSNGGVASARNQGLRIAQGEYIGFVDPDDYVDNDMFETLFSLCIENNAKISCCNAYKQGLKKHKKHRDYIQQMSVDDLFIKTMKECSFGLWNKLWHHSLFQNFTFPENIESGSDLSTYLLVFKTKFAIYLNDYKYHYIGRKGSLCQITSIENRLKRLEIMNEMIKYLKINKPHLIPYSEVLLCNTRFGFIRCLFLMNNNSLLYEQLQYFKKNYEQTYKEQPFFKRCLYKFVLKAPHIYSFIYRINNFKHNIQ